MTRRGEQQGDVTQQITQRYEPVAACSAEDMTPLSSGSSNPKTHAIF